MSDPTRLQHRRTLLLLPLLLLLLVGSHATISPTASATNSKRDTIAFLSSAPPSPCSSSTFLHRRPLFPFSRLTLATSLHPSSTSPQPSFLLPPSPRGGGGGTAPGVGPALRGLLSNIIRKHFLVTGMCISILLAAHNPQIGRISGPLKPEFTINTIGVSLIFLLSGLSLKVQELASAAKDFKLNAAIQTFNLGAGPLLGLAFQPLFALARVDARLAMGLLIVSCLPTTVNMCIVLSGAAGANLALAVFNAVVSNFLGVFIAPATIFACVGATSINVPYLQVIKKLVYKVVFPVFLGITLRAKIPALKKRLELPSSKLPLKLLTEGILVSIIYTTFCQSFLEGLAVTGRDLIGVAVAVPTFHLLSLWLMFLVARAMTSKRDEQITAMFVGSQKTLAFGMPLIRTIFETSPSMALYSAPLLFIHPSQLLIGSMITPFLRNYIEAGKTGGREEG